MKEKIITVPASEIAPTKPVFRNHFNAHALPKDHELNTMPSKTVPDQTMSIAEIMQRYVRNDLREIPPTFMREGVYNGDQEIPDVNKLDLAEKQELRDQVREHFDETKKDAIRKNYEAKKKRESDEARAKQQSPVKSKTEKTPPEAPKEETPND